MDLLSYMRRLFAYDRWANQEVLAALGTAGSSAPRSLKLTAHVVAAERLWLERLRGMQQSLPVWPDFSLQQCEQQAGETHALWAEYLRVCTEGGLSQTITYKNSKGESWSNSAQDILMHVAMHSAYHRGQIAADLRAVGCAPPYTDFIHAVRQGLMEQRS